MSNITSIYISDGLNPTYTDYWFWNANNVTSLYIGNSVETIGAGAFYSCYFTHSLIIPDSVKTIGKLAFSYCTSATGSLVIGNNVEYIGNSAFELCWGLTGDLVIPDSVTFLGSNAFTDCRGFSSLTLGSGLKSIKSYTFSYCDGLSSIVISDNITEIDEGAFQYCTKATEITFGDSITSIGTEAFYVSKTTPTTVNGGNSVVWNYDWAADNREATLTDACKHTNTSVVGAYETGACFEEAYTGDTVCDDCGETIEYGEYVYGVCNPQDIEYIYSDICLMTESQCTVCGVISSSKSTLAFGYYADYEDGVLVKTYVEGDAFSDSSVSPSVGDYFIYGDVTYYYGMEYEWTSGEWYETGRSEWFGESSLEAPSDVLDSILGVGVSGIVTP